MNIEVMKSEAELLLTGETENGSSRESSARRVNSWSLLCLLNLLLLLCQIVLISILISHVVRRNTFESGFETDLNTFRSSVDMVQTRFTGALRPNQEGGLSLHLNPDEPRYVEAPQAEVDQNWENLISGRYFKLSASELSQVDRAGRPNYETQIAKHRMSAWFARRGVYGGIDMFHSLHCLNALRKAALNQTDVMDDAKKLPLDFAQIHLSHCVEQLRQAILCHGDLTPVTLLPVYNEKEKFLDLLGQTEYPHTCRDWRALKTKLGQQDSLQI